MNLTLLDVRTNPQRVQDIWCDLCTHCAHSYFLSWGWVENWLDCLPANCSVTLVVLWQENRPCLAFFIGATRQTRHHLVRSRTLYLNATGIPMVDNLFIEYNAMLRSESAACTLQQILALLPLKWDEFVLPGLDMNTFPGNTIEQTLELGKIIIESDLPSPYVDLDLIRQKNGDYLSLLDKSTRSTISRSYKGYTERGEVVLDVAHDLGDALAMFDELVILHEATWRARGKQSQFATGFSLDFHKKLIRKRFAAGEIQLLRIRAGSATIGCLYNFVFNNNVLFYQNGLHYEEERRLSPGYTCLTEAVKYNAAQGYSVHDFLAGDDTYKKRLSTHENRMVWLTIQKPRAIFRLETGLKTLKRSIVKTN